MRLRLVRGCSCRAQADVVAIVPRDRETTVLALSIRLGCRVLGSSSNGKTACIGESNSPQRASAQEHRPSDRSKPAQMDAG